MFLEKWNKEVCFFKIGSGDLYSRSFVFDLNMLPRKGPRPKKLIFQYRGGKRVREWSMGWGTFGRQLAIGTVVCINKTAFHYTTKEVK